MSPITIEDRLRAASSAIAWPEDPALVHRVGEALVERRSPRSTDRMAIQRWVVVTAGVAALAMVFMFWSPARRAVAQLLGVLGIDIEMVESAAGSSFALGLGEPVELEAAALAVGVEPLRPSAVGEPSGVFLPSVPPGQLVQAWAASSDLPEVGNTGIGLLISQFRSSPTTGGFLKSLPPETTATPVLVGTAGGFWIEGGPHDLSYVDATGVVVTDTTRLAANVLIWEVDGVTFRLESGLELAEAERIAESGLDG